MEQEVKPDEEKDDMEILFPEQEVHGYKIRPWSFGEWRRVAHEVLAIFSLAKKKGVTAENLEERWFDVLEIATPVIPVILMRAMRISEEEMDAWPPEKATAIIMATFKANEPLLKNFSGLKGQAPPSAG